MKKIKFRKRYILYFVMISYLIICQSCMKMRMSSKKTKAFFTTSKIEFTDSIIKLDEHNVHYIQTGQKDFPTLFFIHGSPGSWDAYKEYLKDTLLLKKYRMIAIDRPGFGFSDFGTAENLQVQSKIIYDFIEKVDNKKPIILVGHSMGGPVVTKLAESNPKKYQYLIIISGSVDPKAENPEIEEIGLVEVIFTSNYSDVELFSVGQVKAFDSKTAEYLVKRIKVAEYVSA